MDKQFMEYYKAVVAVILDCLEATINTFVIASGKRIYHVLYVVSGIWLLTFILSVIGSFQLISLIEASIALGLMLIFISIDYFNRRGINHLKEDILEIKNKVRGDLHVRTKRSNN